MRLELRSFLPFGTTTLRGLVPVRVLHLQFFDGWHLLGVLQVVNKPVEVKKEVAIIQKMVA